MTMEASSGIEIMVLIGHQQQLNTMEGDHMANTSKPIIGMLHWIEVQIGGRRRRHHHLDMVDNLHSKLKLEVAATNETTTTWIWQITSYDKCLICR